MILDYNLLNPLVLWEEWRRRRRALRHSPEFARQADFWRMVGRRGRRGARYFPRTDGGQFDDVQFFTPGTLTALLSRVGFEPLETAFSGFVPPLPFRGLSASLERKLCRVPGLRNLGRAYLVTGRK